MTGPRPPLLVLVSGPSGSGKTSVGREIATRTRLPLVAKDDLKELMAEHLPVETLEASRRLGAASFELLYHITEQNLRAGVSQIVEALWDPEFAPRRLGRFRELYAFEVLEIHCTAPARLLLRRARERVTNGERHPVHVDSFRLRDVSLDEFTAAVRRRDGRAPDLGGTTITVDTTAFAEVDYDAICAQITRLADPDT